jgi:hypothetical protein
MRVELVYQIIHKKRGCRFGVDSDGGVVAPDGREISLRDFFGGDPTPDIIVDAVQHLQRYARKKSARLHASLTEKNMVIGILMAAFWRDGIREMKFVEDQAGNIMLFLKQRTDLTPPKAVELPPLDRFDLWADMRVNAVRRD